MTRCGGRAIPQDHLTRRRCVTLFEPVNNPIAAGTQPLANTVFVLTANGF